MRGVPLMPVLLCCIAAWGEKRSYAANPTTKPTTSIESTYDRFEDITSLFLNIQDQLGLLIRYHGKERTTWVDEAIVIAARAKISPLSKIVFLCDGKLVPIDFRSRSRPTLSFELLEALSNAKSLEAAVIYQGERSELTFNANDKQRLRDFVKASGLDEKRKAIAREEERRLQQLRVTAVPEGDVAYVVDATGSMLNTFDAVRALLRRSIQLLEPKQSFCILTYADSPKKFALRKATEENKQEAFDFLDRLFVRGENPPLRSMYQLATAEHPKTIVFISDFDLSEDAKVADFLHEIQGEAVRINTIWMNSDARALDGNDLEFSRKHRDLAKVIAEKGGGVTLIMDGR
jgi:hypothetical protein